MLNRKRLRERLIELKATRNTHVVLDHSYPLKKGEIFIDKTCSYCVLMANRIGYFSLALGKERE